MTATETTTATTAFDTLTAANNLQQAGFSRQQAETLTRTIASVQGTLAAKEDIRRLESRIDSLHNEMKNGMKLVYYVMLPMQLATLASVIVLATGIFKGAGSV
ncbi:MAG: hypothetical protein OXU61_11090 [Gammaproteobacteria bacterium]|nr:hypothetical protein [Gammaproteobacteria bacterium]